MRRSVAWMYTPWVHRRRHLFQVRLLILLKVHNSWLFAVQEKKCVQLRSIRSMAQGTTKRRSHSCMGDERRAVAPKSRCALAGNCDWIHWSPQLQVGVQNQRTPGTKHGSRTTARVLVFYIPGLVLLSVYTNLPPEHFMIIDWEAER